MKETLDYLIVDEAGQLALANVLAAGISAKNLILLGDPQQLAHVSQACHPDGAGVSVLEHLLPEANTVAPTHGAFIETTWRMHPDVCAFVSEVAYDSRLRAEAECAGQGIESIQALTGTGLRFLAVEHEGNTQESEEEATLITAEIGTLSHRWLGHPVKDGTRERITARDILVVAAYNLQVATLREHFREGHATERRPGRHR